VAGGGPDQGGGLALVPGAAQALGPGAAPALAADRAHGPGLVAGVSATQKAGPEEGPGEDRQQDGGLGHENLRSGVSAGVLPEDLREDPPENGRGRAPKSEARAEAPRVALPGSVDDRNRGRTERGESHDGSSGNQVESTDMFGHHPTHPRHLPKIAKRMSQRNQRQKRTPTKKSQQSRRQKRTKPRKTQNRRTTRRHPLTRTRRRQI